ncbi:hypothetical protein ACOSP6_07505 [Tenacibaculum sp. MEBiC06402]|uniref:hypothetical protein n=1 Tax=unclassified Tenacibaculum TaxID=2635139 RepID=UPI003B9CB444
MEENKIDNIIREKFENRELTPSISSWERMENMLDDSKGNSKKKRFYFISVAASIVVILGVYFGMNTKQIKEINNKPVENQIIVTAPNESSVDAIKPEPELTTVIKFEKENQAVAIVEKNEIPRRKSTLKSIKNKNVSDTRMLDKSIPIKEINDAAVAETDTRIVKNQKENNYRVKNARIRVNGEDLLYAVTHSPNEVKEYYANLKLERSDVLDSIKIKLKKSNLKIKPEVILAEVERSIEDDTYQGNFKNNLGRRISTIIVAVANRNK